MINEKSIEQMPVGEDRETLSALLQVFRKVRRWQKATPGRAAVDAESELSSAMEEANSYITDPNANPPVV